MSRSITADAAIRRRSCPTIEDRPSPLVSRSTAGCEATGQVSSNAAQRLGISADAVYWIKAGHLPARRGPGNRLAIPWNADTEAACRIRIASSGHLNRTSQAATAGEAV